MTGATGCSIGRRAALALSLAALAGCGGPGGRPLEARGGEKIRSDAPRADVRQDVGADAPAPDAKVCVLAPGLDATYPGDAFAGSDGAPAGFTFLYRSWFALGTAGHCAQHHVAPMPDLSSRDLAYADLVNVAVPGTGGTLWYVHAGDPAHSILLGSLTGTGWPPMPPRPCTPIPLSAVRAVAAWITAGAPNN